MVNAARFFGVLLLAIALAACSHASAHAASRPNIVLIVAEDMSPHLGIFGDFVARTPRLDALARESVVFTRAYATSPVCAPSRAALATGMHQAAIGAQHMRTRGAAGLPSGAGFDYDVVPPPHVKAFPELLRRAGYATVNAYKTDYQFGEPFTIWDTQVRNDLAWRALPQGRPFFAMINLQVTHESYIWPTDMVAPSPLVQRILARNARDLAPHSALTDPASVVVPPHLPDTPVVRRDLARHYDNIAIMDGQVGAILDALAADGRLRDTIVIWTSDHGDGLPHAKRRLGEAGLHVPLMVRLPDGAGAGTRRNDLVSFVDLAPSILTLAGVAAPPHMHGEALLTRAPARPRKAVFAAADRFDNVPGRARAVIDENFIYIRNDTPARPALEPLPFRDAMPVMQELWRLKAEGGLTDVQRRQFEPRPKEELYDRGRDRDHTRNLASEPAFQGELARLRRLSSTHAARVEDWANQDERAMVETRMWPNLRQPETAPPLAEWIVRDGQLLLSLSSATQGASIGYRHDGDPPNAWRLYTGPARIPGPATVTAKAIRYGFKESSETKIMRN